MKQLLILALLGGAAWLGFHRYQSMERASLLEATPTTPSPRNLPSTSTSTPGADGAKASYTCDGRTYCSQMTSCEEATYFLQHCPGTKMDGDHDGVPCESQWCS